MIIENYLGVPGGTLDTETLEVHYNGKLIGDIEGCHILQYLAMLAEQGEEA